MTFGDAAALSAVQPFNPNPFDASLRQTGRMKQTLAVPASMAIPDQRLS